MQLNLSPVTGEREAAGAVTANSLWFWGGGRAPRLQPRWNALWCNDLVGRGLARLAGVPCHPVPQDGTYRPAPDPQLIVLEGPARALAVRGPGGLAGGGAVGARPVAGAGGGGPRPGGPAGPDLEHRRRDRLHPHPHRQPALVAAPQGAGAVSGDAVTAPLLKGLPGRIIRATNTTPERD